MRLFPTVVAADAAAKETEVIVVGVGETPVAAGLKGM